MIAFEGPGQGGARALGGLTFDHDWRSPSQRSSTTSRLERAGDRRDLDGRVLGDPRRGQEPRIDRVVSWPPVYDWLYQLPRPVRAAARPHVPLPRLHELSIRVHADLPVLSHAGDQASTWVDRHEPMAAGRLVSA